MYAHINFLLSKCIRKQTFTCKSCDLHVDCLYKCIHNVLRVIDNFYLLTNKLHYRLLNFCFLLSRVSKNCRCFFLIMFMLNAFYKIGIKFNLIYRPSRGAASSFSTPTGGPQILIKNGLS